MTWSKSVCGQPAALRSSISLHILGHMHDKYSVYLVFFPLSSIHLSLSAHVFLRGTRMFLCCGQFSGSPRPSS